jgi:hypothetical protein
MEIENMKTITIGGENFEVTAPYLAGHAISEAEAKVLNQTRAENIGNNFRSAVKDALAKNEGMDAVRAQLATYDAAYNFSMGGTTRQPIDPIESEAFKIAREVVKAKLQAKGLKVKDYCSTEAGQAKYDAAVEKVASQDDTIKLAKQRVASRKKALDIASDDLALDA